MNSSQTKNIYNIIPKLYIKYNLHFILLRNITMICYLFELFN